VSEFIEYLSGFDFTFEINLGDESGDQVIFLDEKKTDTENLMLGHPYRKMNNRRKEKNI
jgi:hypothetical protein